MDWKILLAAVAPTMTVTLTLFGWLWHVQRSIGKAMENKASKKDIENLDGKKRNSESCDKMMEGFTAAIENLGVLMKTNFENYQKVEEEKKGFYQDQIKGLREANENTANKIDSIGRKGLLARIFS